MSAVHWREIELADKRFPMVRHRTVFGLPSARGTTSLFPAIQLWLFICFRFGPPGWWRLLSQSKRKTHRIMKYMCFFSQTPPKNPLYLFIYLFICLFIEARFHIIFVLRHVLQRFTVCSRLLWMTLLIKQHVKRKKQKCKTCKSRSQYSWNRGHH